MMLSSDICLSRSSSLSQEQRGLGRLKLAQGLPKSHDSDTNFKVKGQRSSSPGCFTHHGLNASGSCSGERGNVLGVGNYCYVAVCSGELGASAPQREERQGHIVAAAHLQLVIYSHHKTRFM